ncbi:hypothetical protein KM043_018256 [Ampulex compressa]|nr:hypothetical protein KM043_018256 [Ampulex compressa]
MVQWKIYLIIIIVVTGAINLNGGALSAADSFETELDGLTLNDEPYSGDYLNNWNIKRMKGGRRRIFAGGCTIQPKAPINGRIKCSMDSGCIATCSTNYKFPNGVAQLAITCSDKQWNIFGTDWNSIPHCEPICMPECQNNGICIAPDQCNCSEHFTGPQCEYENKPCLDYPVPVLNSYRRCNSKSCTISCMKNFTFPDGSSVANMICKNANWVPTRPDWVTIPACEPVCNPSCQNGGNCLPTNLCQCPQAFRGPQCQYSVDACSTEKLNFNGGFYCISDSDSYSCRLNCPPEIEFEFPPSAFYKCTYDTGIFNPQPIPQCKFENNVNVISLGTSYNSYIRETNQSWAFEDTFDTTIKQSPVNVSYNAHGFYKTHQTSILSNPMLYNPMEDNVLLVEQEYPKPKTCFTWGGKHYKTFDDRIFSVDSNCSHILLQEMWDSILTITVQNSPGCAMINCSKIIKLFVQGKEYTLKRNELNMVEFSTSKKSLAIPLQLPGLHVKSSAHFTVISLDSLGVKLKWDGSLLLQIEALENMWNRTAGLCGSMNGDMTDDFRSKTGDYAKSIAMFTKFWITENLGETCDEYPRTSHSCTLLPTAFTQEAIQFCTKLLLDPRFHACIKTIKFTELEKACIWDYCACPHDDKMICVCETMNVYIRQCAHKKIISLSGWRNNNTCPMACSNGRIYMGCGPKAEASCWNSVEAKSQDADCEEGCFCPGGTVTHDGKCISPEQCPCRLRGKLFQPGVSVPKDCNTCTCSSGKWICTQIRCGARCAVIGDPHYTTFDGKHYDFMGRCKYYLVQSEDYSVEGENVPCFGALSESMGFASSDAPSCTKTVTINTNDMVIKLKQNQQVLVNGDDVTVLPASVHGVRLRIASNIFLVVHLPNELEIWWDGISRVYINAPASLYGKTKGLCGTFTANQKDDFLTRDGDVEERTISFANKWKTTEDCADIPEKEIKHPCDFNPHRRAAAEEYCSKLYSDIFSACHWHVDPEPFHRDCLFDMCACEVKVESCLCPTLAAYAKDCAAVNVKILWRQYVAECMIHCPGDQVYQICGNSCTRSCSDISVFQDCKEECVEGCNCPRGQTLDINGECIPIGECPCTYAGLEFKSGHKEVHRESKASELCTCAGGLWSCRLASQDEIQEYPAGKDLLTTCTASKNMQVTDCKPTEPRTCHSMGKLIVEKPMVCKSGCICKPGYVLNALNGTCIKETSCPCHHGGKSYEDKFTIQDGCNTCQCINGKWKCTDRICAGICSAWGDSHYKTFDNRFYEFQGICDYVFVKGALNKEDSFDVSIQNVPCGTTGASCSKSVVLIIGSGDNQEVVILTKGKELPVGNFNRMTMRIAGSFVFLDVPDFGLVVQWDKVGTRVYVRLDPKWKGRTKGLCGDYNDNSEDDFKTPSGGIAEVSANLFGDSWKKDDACPEPKNVEDPCEQNLERKLWSTQKCGILKSEVFRPCHSEVNVESYLHNCIFDTCGCDTEDTCIEGCSFKPCSEQEVYQNGSYTNCVPKAQCKPFCIDLNGISYYEGDKVSSDDCQTCFCSRGKVICKGGPCTIETTPSTVPLEQPQKCVDGWTIWVNKDPAVKGKKWSDIEPLPTPLDLENKNGSGICSQEHMIDIRCRSVKSHISPKESGLDVECSLEHGLYCSSIAGFPCIDFEISVLCQCSTPTTKAFDTTIDIFATIKASFEQCNVSYPNRPHDTNCQLFYQCVDDVTGAKWVEKTCGPNLFYNPKSQTCDWPANVIVQKPECALKQTDAKTNTYQIKNESTVTTALERKIITANRCSAEQIWDNCAIKCSRTCEYYHYTLTQQGHCKDDSDCVAGCISTKEFQCPLNKFWKNATTCVDITECFCTSHGKKPVIPGAIMKESPCEVCQCINNYYTCDKSLCFDLDAATEIEVKPETTTKLSLDEILQTASTFASEHISISGQNEQTIVVLSTVSPPPDCYSGDYVPLIQTLKSQVTYNASSIKGPLFQPQNIVLNGKISEKSAGYWEPKYMDTDQWLDVKFQKPEPIYSIIVQGSNVEDTYVTSYRILFSEDGHTFSYVLNDKEQPRVFQGPVDGIKSIEQKFSKPIEARVIRINPLTWHNGITIKMELLGCQEYLTTALETRNYTFATTSIIFEKNVQPECEDPMGLDNNVIVPEQVSASSSLTKLLPNLKLTSTEIWRPKLDNPHQYIQFDFLASRKITGIQTKGYNNIWTTAYKILYSIDGHRWNPITDENGLEVQFIGNFDDQTIKTNFFDKPLQANYLKIQPVKWHRHIGLKVEVLGCFLPYPIATTTVSPVSQITTEKVINECKVCDGIFVNYEANDCKCEKPYWWNGNTCVSQQECPCIVGHVSYVVGTIYENEDCQQCICTLGGTSACLPKQCNACHEPGMRSELTKLCECVCKPCPIGTRHCPTSDTCVNETLWCDGVQNCPDDENNCTIVLPTTTSAYLESINTINFTLTSPKSIQSVSQVCQDPICPPGYKTVLKQPKSSPTNTKSYTKSNTKHFSSNFFKTKSLRKKVHHHDVHEKKRSVKEIPECQQFTCVPNKLPPVLHQTKTLQECQEAKCPPNYMVVYEKMSMYKLQKCPKYTCKPPILQEAICNVTGRTFNTFDNLEYKYDICNHILARDRFENKWYITLEKQCGTYETGCKQVLAITMDNDTVVLHSDMHVDVNEYTFNASQVKILADKIPSFKITNIGDTIYLISNLYGFWIIWDSNSNIKIGVPMRLIEQIDGLCGYFDGYMKNDRQMPDESQAKTTIEFGDSWAMDGVPECDSEICPYDIQVQAWTICNTIKDYSLGVCSSVMDIEKFVSRCIESTCICLRGNKTYHNCRCRILTTFITECQAADLSVDLSSWRTIYDCPISCPSPFVHKDCFRNKCETSCYNLQQIDPCPVMSGVCFPGCFCPEGTVRNGDDCVQPTHCQDCICEWFGNSNFISFDRRNIKFDGNCTYVLSRDTEHNVKDQNGKHSYQVLVSTTICSSGACTESIIVLYDAHVIQLKQTSRQEFQVVVDGSEVSSLPYNATWCIIDRIALKDVKLFIPAIQLEVTSFQLNFAIALKVPSHIFGGMMEGLCGNCNEDVEDDLQKRDGKITDNFNEFGMSWLVTDLLYSEKLDISTCTSSKEDKCIPSLPNEDPCRRILNTQEFGQCHNLVDPMPYLISCQDAVCAGGSYCNSIEAYARRCVQMGICLVWRSNKICPYECPQYLEYQPCGPRCKKTCDSINAFEDVECASSFMEGCFCPHNYVLHNNTCIPKKKCFLCDEEGHVDGDVWYPDICTKCYCNSELVTCEKKECPAVETVCNENMIPILINGTQEECCPKYLCVPKMTTTVTPLCTEEIPQLDCGFGQIKKVSINIDGCHKFICECLPMEECPLFNEVTLEAQVLEPGVTQIMNTTGCCPRPALICNIENCPEPRACPSYYERKIITESDACCPTYRCVPPIDKCLFTVPPDIALKTEEYVIAKEIGEEWKDGKCKTCLCENTEEGPSIQCFTMECMNMEEHPDFLDFVLEEVLLETKCCPGFKRSACKNGNEVYNVGETWVPNFEDVCTYMECVEEANKGIQKQMNVRDCNTTCPVGYEYSFLNDKTISCCGTCVQIACIIGKDLKNVGEEWFSNDHCTRYSCDSIDGNILVRAITQKCAEIDPMDEEEFELEKRLIPHHCCPEIVKTACRYRGQIYQPGQRWKSLSNSCVTEICVLEFNVTKQREVEVCSKECPAGWIYKEPNNDECCGKCKEAFCIVEEILYEPGATWLSEDNCTIYTCIQQGDQLSISSSSMVCPDVTNCPPDMIYTSNCCKQCNLTSLSQQVELCMAEFLDADKTIGLLNITHSVHGVCKNVESINGMTQCHGKCESGTYLNIGNWKQISNCKCCQPNNYIIRTIELTCEDRKILKKQLAIPTSCSCAVCEAAYSTKEG